MLSDKVLAAYNNQITAELYASNLYLAMGAYFDALAYRGFGNWLRVQSEEERGHALRIIDIVVDRGGDVDIQSIEATSARFESPVAVFEQVLAQEREVTRMFHDLSNLAEQESDHTTLAELEWFLLEQVEEERVAGDILKEVRRVQDNLSGMLVLDREVSRACCRKRPTACCPIAWVLLQGASETQFATVNWSGQWDSNPRSQPWEGRMLPLHHARKCAQIHCRRIRSLCQAFVVLTATALVALPND